MLIQRLQVACISTRQAIGHAVSLLRRDDAAAIDKAIVAGYRREPVPKDDAWVHTCAIATIRAEPW